MLPHGYEQPAAIALLLGGVLACFAGYRLFRIVLGIYGFILGAMIASSIVGVSNTTGMLVAAIVGGLIGSVVLVFAWFVGVSLVGAGIGVLIAHVAWTQVGSGDPPAIAIIAVAVAGAIGAMFVQKYVIVVGTAFGGAWTIVLAAANAFPVHEGGADPRCVGHRGVDLLSDLRPRHALGADDLEGGVGAPSRWNTLRALRVLDWWDRSARAAT